MGQLANDWTQLKTIIRQKDDALDRQTAQIADLQKQLAAQQQAALDADDAKAVAELRQTIAANAPSPNEIAPKVIAPAITPPPPATNASATHSASATSTVSPQPTAVTTFTK